MIQEKFEEKDKLKVLTDIAEEVNSKENAKIDGIENDALVVVSDIEGRAKDFLLKLKHTGVIDRVDVNKETGKLKICLNENFCGTIDFCGDLTAYKVFTPFSNEIVIEVFEELLAQIKKHNEKNKEKDKQIQFVAVPGNHEFYRFWGGDDGNAIYSRDDGGKNPLLIKLKSLKVIAEIQKYFLEQVQKNKDDITDNDYQGTDVNIEERIKLLDNECKMLDTIYNALSDKGIDPANYFDYFIHYKAKKEDLQKEKGIFKNGHFMIKTKGGKITNEDCTINDDNKFFWQKNPINKEKLKKIFKDDACRLPFSNILKILESNGKGQENSGECTEWTEYLINEKLNDLKSVLEGEDVALNESMKWLLYRDNLEEKLTSIKNLETKLNSFETFIQALKKELSQNGYIKQEEIEDENPKSLLRPLFWDKSALLSKIIFNHRGKKFRTLHHFGLFVPKRQQVNNLNKDNQNEIFANAFLTNNQFNIDALDTLGLRYLKRDIFENNKIPTLFGHEGRWLLGAQTSNMYCVDTGYNDGSNVVCVVDSNNNITPYYTYKCIKLKNEKQRKTQNQQNLKNEEQKKQNQQNVVELKLGDYDGEKIKLAIYDCKPQENKSEQQQPENIVNAIFENGEQQPVPQKNNIGNLNNLTNNTTLEAQKLESNNDNKDNNNNDNNLQIIQASDTMKNGNDESLKALLASNNDDLKQTIEENRGDLKTVEDYVNGNIETTEQQKVAEAISSLIVKNNASSLEEYSRTFAFSHKDKRAQQVYQTYKMLAESQNELNTGNSPKQNQAMIELDSIHSINTPCGCGCF